MSNFKILVVNKEEGVTSFRSLSEIKKLHKGSKVGHTGTLDRFATGLMVVLVGQATKLNPLFSSLDKSYKATLKLGKETTTLDYEGDVIKESELPTKEKLLSTIEEFKGEIKQRPPIYSALHVDGKRAYERALKGEEVILDERDVTIYKLELLSLEDDIATIDTHVSKGTYIRSLARDIAIEAGSCAHLIKLDRYTVGPFTKDDVTTLDPTLEECNRLLTKLCKEYIYFDKKYLKSIKNGYFDSNFIIYKSSENDGYYRLLLDDNLFGVIYKKECKYKIICLVEND